MAQSRNESRVQWPLAVVLAEVAFALMEAMIPCPTPARHIHCLIQQNILHNRYNHHNRHNHHNCHNPYRRQRIQKSLPP